MVELYIVKKSACSKDVEKDFHFTKTEEKRNKTTWRKMRKTPFLFPSSLDNLKRIEKDIGDVRHDK